MGKASAGSGVTYGVHGQAFSAGGIGVYGQCSDGGSGVFGYSAGGTPLVGSGNGGSYLIELFDVTVGQERRFRVDTDGEVYADGSFHSGGADFAELYPASCDMPPGTVAAIGDDGKVEPASAQRPTAVMGVVASNPSIVGNSPDDPEARENHVPVAILGIVDVHASAGSGPIRPGDLLMAGSRQGTAEKAVWARPGTVIGKALESLESGEGTIRILVTLR